MAEKKSKTDKKVKKTPDKESVVNSPGAEINPAELSPVARLLDGLTILERHGASEVFSQAPEICVAGPNLNESIPEQDQRMLEDLGWIWYEMDGWVFETL